VKPFPALSFALDNKRAAVKLIYLIDWLEAEGVRLGDELARVPDDKPVKDAMGRQIVGENERRRADLRARIATTADDIAAARTWLLECEVNQTWHIGLDIAHWLNRPALVDSAKG
jgi:hypothetical protein